MSYPPQDLPAQPAPTYEGQYVAPQNTPGTVSLVLGIISLVFGGLVLGIPAMILGRKGQRLADEGKADNRGSAKAGFICGLIGTLFSVIGIILVIVMLAFGSSNG